MEITIKLTNLSDINVLLPLFHRLGITFKEKVTIVAPQKNQLPITFAKNPDYTALNGLWKDKKITAEALREAAWGDRL
jgi:hypothetical protein